MSTLFKLYFSKIPVPVLVFSVLYLLLIIISRDIPMFWDMCNTSWLSNLIYDNHFTNFIFPENDAGAVGAVYSTYLAALWIIFGRSLLVSHMAVLPFVIGIVFQFYSFAKTYIQKEFIWIALLLLFVEPTLFTQVFLAGNDLVLCFLFLLGVNSAISNKKILLMFAVGLMPILRLRGFTFVFSVFLIDWYMNRTNYKGFINFTLKRSYIYLTPLIIPFAWFSYHYYSTGWIFISKTTKNWHQFAGIERMFKNLIYVFWKAFDFGRIFLFASVLILFLKQKKKDTIGRQLIFILLFTILPYLVFFIPLLYPVSHRHFMISYIVVIIAFVYFLSSLKKIHRTVILVLAILCLLSGNFWLYPERYGNGWDASMKVYPYFKLRDNFDGYIKLSGINPDSIGAKFPMGSDLYTCKLEPEKFGYQYIYDRPLEDFNFIVQSNICNTFTPDEIERLNMNWILEKEFRSWPLYIRLYRKP
jgi:hypothetical protein